MNTKETKKNIIRAGHKAVDELIKVAKEEIVDSDEDISADRLKNAAATKKLEENILNDKPSESKKQTSFRGFAEGRSK